MALKKREEARKALKRKKDNQSGGTNGGGGFGNFFAATGKILVIATPIILGVIFWRYIYHVKDSLPR